VLLLTMAIRIILLLKKVTPYASPFPRAISSPSKKRKKSKQLQKEITHISYMDAIAVFLAVITAATLQLDGFFLTDREDFVLVLALLIVGIMAAITEAETMAVAVIALRVKISHSK